jgi:SAM-dependent methyltransferase
MDNIARLKTLYVKATKHSNYQVLPEKLVLILGNDMEVKSRYENERLTFILKNLEIQNKTILDIGGNTGFFTIELIENGAKHVDYYEGNQDHSEFVRLASELLGISMKVNVINKYLNFENELNNKHYDVILLLNVLHHLGDDYGDKSLSLNNAKKVMLNQLNSLADKTSFLVFQLGFNWKGNRNCCLFELGTKKEMVDFISNGTKNFWKVHTIGVAEKENDRIIYKTLNSENIKRMDSLGEFLNRPLFILKSEL